MTNDTPTPRTTAICNEEFAGWETQSVRLAKLSASLERENAALRATAAAQLEELKAVDIAIGSNEGHSAVEHILALREDKARLAGMTEFLLDEIRAAIDAARKDAP